MSKYKTVKHYERKRKSRDEIAQTSIGITTAEEAEQVLKVYNRCKLIKKNILLKKSIDIK
jgi:hypothetical protein